MKNVARKMLGLALGAATALGLAGPVAAQSKGEIVVGDQCDRTGATQIVGIRLCAAVQDYINLFPMAATYWSQGAAAIQFVKEKLGGNLKGKKIAYVFYDNPAGREAIPILEDLQKIEGYELRTFAVPPPGVEMGAQVLDITQRYRPDFVIDHLFGRSPSVAIKEYKRAGYPLSKVMGLVWASRSEERRVGGGCGGGVSRVSG